MSETLVNWLTWAIESRNWFLGAMASALIVYMGRGCVSIISRQRKVEEHGEANEHYAIPIWLAYVFLILSTIIPTAIIAVVIVVNIIKTTAPYGIWSILLDIETISFIIYIATGFLLGLIVWGSMRMFMWMIIDGLSHRKRPDQEKVKRSRSAYSSLKNMLRKGLFSDRRIEMAIREAIGKHTERLFESDLEGLTELDANKRKVIELNGIEYCKNLRKLYLFDNQIRDISPLSGLINLEELVLTDGGIGKIGPLSNLTKLQRLRMGSNYIADIRPLSELTNLRELYLRGNQITSVAPLSNLTNLQELQLGANQIRSVNPLENLISLRELVLADNWIDDIAALSNLTNLQELDLRKNQIKYINPLVNNSGMGKGTTIDLTDNPLSDEAYDIHIPALQERGITVQFNPKP